MKSANVSPLAFSLLICASPLLAATSPATAISGPNHPDLQLAFLLTLFFGGTWVIQAIRR